jgi:hypothetical protein
LTLRSWGLEVHHKKAFEAVAKLQKAERNGKVMPDLPYNGSTREPDKFGLIARDLDVTATTTIQDEREAFADDVPFAISGTACSWWLEPAQQKRYPMPSQMAMDILSILAMSQRFNFR